MAVLAGIVTTVGISLLTDMVMQTAHIFPVFGEPMSDRQSAIATAYRIVYGALGAWVIARLAPNRPMGHAMVSGLLGVIAATAGAAATWNAAPSLGPRWYPLALIVTALPSAWVGAKIYEAQRANPKG